MKKSIYPDYKQEQAVLQITAHYVEQAQSGQKPSLSDYLVRYPAYTDAIVDFVAYYHAFEEPLPQKMDTSVACETLSAVSQLALEYIWQRVSHSGQRWLPQMQTLLMRKDHQPLSLSYLATELDLSVDIVMQLERRRIDPASIPLALFRHLAQVLQQPLDVIQTYFPEDSPPGTSSGTVYQKVAELPEAYAVSPAEKVPRVSFDQALQASSQMSERQNALWRAIIECENV